MDLLYAAHNPHPREYCLFEAFLVKECKGSDVNIGLFLDTLYSRPIVPVNFAAFAKYVRLLRRILLRRSRDQQLLFSSYLVRCARVYFPYQITRTCEGSFRKFLRLLGGLPLLRPHDLSDQRSVIISLQSEERDEEWEHRLVEQLVSEVLVDKKNQSDNPFKLNSFFGKLLVRHFPRIYPQLERLMIRSESNIEVWQEILATVVIFKHIDPHVMPLLNRIKHLFVTHA